MTTSSQEQADAAQLIERISGMIIADERYADRRWSGISVVAVVDGDATQVTGYSYDLQGRPQAGTPRNPEIHDRFIELQAVTQMGGRTVWKTCLVQIRRDALKARMEFEYDDAARWKVTPRTLEIMPIRLRPA